LQGYHHQQHEHQQRNGHKVVARGENQKTKGKDKNFKKL